MPSPNAELTGKCPENINNLNGGLNMKRLLKSKRGLLALVTCSVLLSVFIIGCNNSYCSNPVDFKVGKTYIMTNDNPFDSDPLIITVVNIKDEYMQYRSKSLPTALQSMRMSKVNKCIFEPYN